MNCMHPDIRLFKFLRFLIDPVTGYTNGLNGAQEMMKRGFSTAPPSHVISRPRSMSIRRKPLLIAGSFCNAVTRRKLDMHFAVLLEYIKTWIGKTLIKSRVFRRSTEFSSDTVLRKSRTRVIMRKRKSIIRRQKSAIRDLFTSWISSRRCILPDMEKLFRSIASMFSAVMPACNNTMQRMPIVFCLLS